jgi:hypothetical protein
MLSRSDYVVSQLARLPYFIGLWKRLQFGSAKQRMQYGIFDYPAYAYGIYWAATLASRLKIPRITVAEFGVAGGRGLVAMERISAQIEADLGVGIDVFGFDNASGMPPPVDYRDMPHMWGEGFYEMDVEKLQSRLQRAKLVLGNVADTVPKWIEAGHAPLGFVSFDLDYYSSTKVALSIFDSNSARHLPRVHSYFDDVALADIGCMNPYVGELLAIREFNDVNEHRKICKVEQLRLNRTRFEDWQERMFVFHDFVHPRYCDLVVPRDGVANQLPLGG